MYFRYVLILDGHTNNIPYLGTSNIKVQLLRLQLQLNILIAIQLKIGKMGASTLSGSWAQSPGSQLAWVPGPRALYPGSKL